MSNPAPGRRWRVAFWLYVGFLLLILALAYLRLVPVEIAALPLYDTAGHFLLLGLAAFLGHRATGRRSVTVLALPLPLAPLLVALVAGIEELLQGFSPNRTSSLLDFGADLCGILIFYVLDTPPASRLSAFARRAWQDLARGGRPSQ